MPVVVRGGPDQRPTRPSGSPRSGPDRAAGPRPRRWARPRLGPASRPRRRRGRAGESRSGRRSRPRPRVPSGPFTPVRVNDELTLDFDQRGAVHPSHVGFLVDDVTLDAVLGRLETWPGVPYGSGPEQGWDRSINHVAGGRGVYVGTVDGHSYEFFTAVPPGQQPSGERGVQDDAEPVGVGHRPSRSSPRSWRSSPCRRAGDARPAPLGRGAHRVLAAAGQGPPERQLSSYSSAASLRSWTISRARAAVASSG